MPFPARSAAPRWSPFLLAALATLAVALWLMPGWQPALAQDAAPAAGADAPAEPPNLFVHIVKSAGPVFGGLLFIVSICLVALIVLLILDLRMSVAVPPGFVEEFTDTVNKRQFKQAFDLARNDQSFLGRVLTAGMSRLQYGLDDAREAAANMLEAIRAGKEQLNNYTAVIGTLGPMIGLVGTVYGMILAFMELGQPGKTPNPAKLADGISHALVITLLGIALSVPAIFFNTFFRNRIVRIGMETGNIADDLLTQMYHNSKKAGAVPTATPSSTATPVAAPAAGVKTV
jgi:biopolymer transport protein ExbB